MSDDMQVDSLRDDIEQTRDSMSETIDQLEERLAPERLQHDTTEIVREVADKIIAEVQGQTGDLTRQITDQIQAAIHGAATAKSEEVLTQAMGSLRTVGSSLWDRVGSSPAPVALAAVGIGLLAAGTGSAVRGSQTGISGSTSTADGNGAGMTGMVDDLKTKAQSAAERASGVVSDVSQESGSILKGAKSKAANVSVSPEQAQGVVSDQPLLAGLLALGLGVALGLSLPSTEQEREATSSLRQQAHDRLDEMGIASNPKGMLDQAKEQLRSVGDSLSEAATTGLEQAKETGADLASTAKETAAEAANDRGLTR